MKIKIIETFKIGRNTGISFDSSVGTGVAIWKGSDSPITDKEYDVEIDIVDKLEKGRTAFPTTSRKYSIHYDDVCLFFCGEVDSIDNDDMVYFRLAQNCLIMIESDIASVKVGEWLLMKFSYESIEIFPQGG